MAAPDREAAFRRLFIEPWRAMLSMFAAHGEGASDGSNKTAGVPDPLDGARAWNWVMPNDLPPAGEEFGPLAELVAADAWSRCADAMERAAARFEQYAEDHGIEEMTGWIVIADPRRADPIMRGYTGGTDWMEPRFILQFDTPNEYNLARVEGMTAHEMQHLLRFRAQPFNPISTTVADYIVAEGTAEAFAASLFGEDVVGYYVTEFDGSELGTARRIIGENLKRTGFNEIRSFIFGDHWARSLGLPAFGVPTYGGYAIGYQVVKEYLKRSGKSIEEATFLSGEEICRESGFFS